MNNNRIDSLDALRGISSLIVVIFHCLISFPIFYNANYKSDYANSLVEIFTVSPLKTIWAGKEAVLLFFILSGFVLALPFLNNNFPSYKNFIIKRFFRIYIPYILIMFVSIILMTLFAEYKNIDSMSPIYNGRWNHPITIDAIVGFILMLNFDISNVNAVVWTLYHEMRISLFFPFLMIIIVKFNDWKKSLITALGVSILFLFLFGFLSNSSNNFLSELGFSFYETMYYTNYFIFGAILARCKNEVILLIKPISITKKVLIFIMSLLFINNRWVDKILNFKSVLLEDIISAIGIIILFSLVISSQKIEIVLTKNFFLFLGKISYSLYLVHIPVLMLTTTYLSKLFPIEITFILVPCFSILIANLAYRFIEIPSINLGKKVTTRLQVLTKDSEIMDSTYFQEEKDYERIKFFESILILS